MRDEPDGRQQFVESNDRRAGQTAWHVLQTCKRINVVSFAAGCDAERHHHGASAIVAVDEQPIFAVHWSRCVVQRSLVPAGESPVLPHVEFPVYPKNLREDEFRHGLHHLAEVRHGIVEITAKNRGYGSCFGRGQSSLSDQ